MPDWLIRRINRIKENEKGEVLVGWEFLDLLRFCTMLTGRLFRGLAVRLRIKTASGPILSERGVRLYHPGYISAGRWLNIEEGCEIVGISRCGIVFGDRCTIGRFATIRPTNVLLDTPGEGLIMGDHSNIGAYSYVGCSGLITIGNHVMMGPRVNLLAENHHYEDIAIPIKEQGVEREFITIGDDCWISAGCTILAGVTVGKGAVIAAGAVVTKDVSPYSVVAGIPAVSIRSRT